MKLFNKVYAFIMGYFWLPCPICNKYFGGHQTNNCSSVYLSGVKKIICRSCTKEGYGQDGVY